MLLSYMMPVRKKKEVFVNTLATTHRQNTKQTSTKHSSIPIPEFHECLLLNSQTNTGALPVQLCILNEMENKVRVLCCFIFFAYAFTDREKTQLISLLQTFNTVPPEKCV